MKISFCQIYFKIGEQFFKKHKSDKKKLSTTCKIKIKKKLNEKYAQTII